MDGPESVPVRGPSKGRVGEENTNQNAMVNQASVNQEARIVARLSREDLEDKYLRLYEDNLILKKHARKQEEKIKKMATKLLRLVNDKKHGYVGTKQGREIENEEVIEDLKIKVIDLEKQNLLLKEKLLITKQQVTSGPKRANPYGNVQSRINTGRTKAEPSERIVKSMRVAGPRPPAPPQSPTLPRYGHSLLEQSRADIRHLEDVIAQQNDQISVYEQDIEVLKEQMRLKEAEFEEDLLVIKQQVSAGQRANLQENVDLIRLQREVKEKGTKLTKLQAQYDSLEDNTRTIKGSHDRLMAELESLNQQIKSEQTRNLALKNQLKAGSASHGTIVELEEQVKDLRNENQILKEANEKLVSSAFDLEREREWRQRENALKVQIAQLEATLKADVGEKGSILDRLSGERQNAEKLDKELREERLKYFQLKEEHDELKDKMKFFTRESAVDFAEIEEALVLIKQRKEQQGAEEISFLQQVDEEKSKDLEKEVNRLHADHAETIEELEKTRNMLIVQHKINKDYQTEVEAVTTKMEENRLEYETKLDEYAQLLDLRAARIKKLEGQMKDVAYGTRQYRVQAPGVEDEGGDEEVVDETIHLERGQNMFEIHVTKVILSADGVKLLGDDDPSLFCTWEFFEYETQSTPVVKGTRPEFDFTSQYVVKVDDFFLHYLQKETTTLELHQALGTEFRTVAACQLRFRDIFDKPHGRVMGAADLIGIAEGAPGYTYGTVEFWVRLKVPMDQALRLYKERTKALGYLTANQRAAEQAVSALDESAAQRPDDSLNELHLKVIRCKNVNARREGMQPSPYCMYKFFDFPDRDTTIVPNTNSPEFMDHHTFPVTMTADLDQYLKSQPLLVYVFDDTDPEEATYLGVATVPMLALAHDKAIKGTFELKRDDGSVNGTMDIDLRWQYSYIPPKASTKTVAQILATTPQLPRERPPMLPGEDVSILAGAPSAVSGPTISHMPTSGPSAMSTPKPRSLAQVKQSTERSSPASPGPRPMTMTPVKEVETPKAVRPVPMRRMGDAKKTVEFSDDVVVSGGHVEQQVVVEQEPPIREPHPPPARNKMDVLVEKSESGQHVVVDVARPPAGGADRSAAEMEGHGEVKQGIEVNVEKSASGKNVVVDVVRKSKPRDEEVEANKQIEESVEVSSQENSPELEVDNEVIVSQDDDEGTMETGELSDTLQSDELVQSSRTVSPLPPPQQLHPGKKSKGKTGNRSKNANEIVADDVGDEESEDEADLVASEMARAAMTAGATAKPLEDTTFGEEVEDEEEEEEDSDDDVTIPDSTQKTEEPDEDSDSEGLVVASPTRGLSSAAMVSDTVVIIISHLSLEDHCDAIQNPAIQKLFVEYRFLGYPAEELETPFSLPKPKPLSQIAFNFRKVFHVDMENNYEHRQYLASMLLPDDPDDGRICFTIVSEPSEDSDDEECCDVGLAFVSLRDILKTGHDLMDQDVDIVDVDDESTVIGTLNVTVECIAALRAVQQEMSG